MGFLEFSIILIMAILIGLCVYRITDLTSKLNRIRRRYDLLLRGRGDLNLEELLSAHSGDIENLLNRMKEIESINKSLNKNLDDKNNVETRRIEENINEIDNRLSSQHNSFNKEISNRVSILERKQSKNFEELNNKMDFSIDNLNKSIKNNFNEAKSESNNSIRKLAEKQDLDIKDIVQKNEEFKIKITEETSRSLQLMKDQLAFAVQKVALKRYNALENQSGDLSFTIVMLDQFNSGIMLTCINGRDSSYTYSKAIKNGKSELECSPEELETLNEALDKKEKSKNR